MTTFAQYDHKVEIPEGELDGLRVERFTVDAVGALRSRIGFRSAGRGVPEGTYTKLMEGGRLWMSDTPAEWRDHGSAVWRIRKPETKRVLINGLGLGMVLKAALAQPHVEHVDVVEYDERVIKLIGAHYVADPRVTIHHADAYTIKWAPGVRWDVAWHDIWPEIVTTNLPEMTKLHRKYGRRVDWQDSWCRELLQYHRDRERARARLWG